MRRVLPIVVLFGDMDDEFGADFADSYCFDFVDIDFSFDIWVGGAILVVSLRL